MSLVHNATISPSKQEVAQQWLATTDWFGGDTADATAERRFSYRFDDPAGQVGVESILVRHGDQMFQLPLTYRDAELSGAEQWFLTEMDHSALGQRWIYFGLGDPVLVNALIAAIRTGQRQEDYQLEGESETFPSPVTVRGTGNDESVEPVEITGHDANGSTSVVHTTGGDLVIPHVLGSMGLGGRPGLVGQWPEGPSDVVFAVLGSGRSV